MYIRCLYRCLVEHALSVGAKGDHSSPGTLFLDLHKFATETLVAASADSRVQLCTFPRAGTLLALGSDSTVGSSTKATNAGLARKASTAASAARVIVGRAKEVDICLADRSDIAATEALDCATLNPSFLEIQDRTAALANCKVLAALVHSSGLGEDLFHRWWASWLTDGVLASFGHSRTKVSSHWCLRETTSSGNASLGAIGVGSRRRRVDYRGERVRLLVTATESVGGRWRERLIVDWRRA
jgi:hypothetical protein